MGPEPTTELILNNEYTPEQCARMFIKNGSLADKAASIELSDLISRARDLEPGSDRDFVLDQCTRLINRVPDSAKGLRIDFGIEHGGCTIWADVGGVHGTAKTYVSKQSTYFNGLAQLDHMGDGDSSSSVVTTQSSPITGVPASSPAICKVVREKQDRYNPMLRVAELQLLRRKRNRMPNFHALIISTDGEFSSSVFEVIEWLCAIRKRQCTEFRPIDGTTPARASARFRTDLKDSLAIANAIGLGTMLRSVGIPNGPAFSSALASASRFNPGRLLT